MLSIKNLSVEAKCQKLLEKLNLNLKPGTVNLLLGPNGSGKSTFSQVVAGNPEYRISEGEIRIENPAKSITLNSLKPEEIARKRVFVSFQNPVEIEGVKTIELIKEAYTQIFKQKPKASEFLTKIKQLNDKLELPDKFYQKDFNVSASGGQKKKNELLQMFMLDPELIILDEIDSGLDIDSLKICTQLLKEFCSFQKTVLLISHNSYLAENLPIDQVFVLNKGKLSDAGKFDLFEKIQQKGYQNL